MSKLKTNQRLIAKMADVLLDFESELRDLDRQRGAKRASKKQREGRRVYSTGKHGRRIGSVGDRYSQYKALATLYEILRSDERFRNGLDNDSWSSEKRSLTLKRFAQLRKVVRHAFKLAFGEFYSSRRQRARSWASVLQLAWEDSVPVEELEIFILRAGGIQRIYNICSKDIATFHDS
ncbi:hypothetical protein [Aestuariivirga sp.]|uniref:hypothetical protein n=1 Tax=Aestuariivirga sp. TaxID=2650926 RepID=UPI0039E52B83